MNSSDRQINSVEVERLEQGRAIARGMDEIQTQKDRNQAKAGKRMKTMIRNAAEKVFFSRLSD